MVLDEFSGTLHYGYGVHFSRFSFDKLKINATIPIEYSTDKAIEEADGYLSDCWNLYKKSQGSVVETELKNISCMTSYDTKLEDSVFKFMATSCRFVFGFEIKENKPLNEVVELSKFPEYLPRSIAEFVVLFNESNIFSDIWYSKASQSDKESERIKAIVERSSINEVLKSGNLTAKIDKFKIGLDSPGLIIGCD